MTTPDVEAMPEVRARRRTYEWSDPAVSAAAAMATDGLTFLQAIASGEVPGAPIAANLGFTIETVEAGRVVFGLVPSEAHYNPIGSVHGGVYATLLDSACGCAVQSLLPAGSGYTSLDLTVKFLRPLTVESGPVHCEGTVTHLGRRSALAEARIVDDAGKLHATATSSCMIFRPEAV